MDAVPSAEEVVAALREHPDLYLEVRTILRWEAFAQHYSPHTGRIRPDMWRYHRIPSPSKELPLTLTELRPAAASLFGDLDYADMEMRVLTSMGAAIPKALLLGLLGVTDDELETGP